jgi:4-hydroxy-3-polyprenylbenzoate decarboxylase
MSDSRPQRLALGVSGASGAVLALRLAEAVLAAGWDLEIVCSGFGRLMWRSELGRPFEDDLEELSTTGAVRAHKPGDLASPLASGSYPIDAYAIVPASMATVAALASGVGSNLIHRMGDVAIKEKRRLLLAPRESPLSPIHLTNLLRLSELGAIVAPPMPAFYERPGSLDEVIEATVDRLLVWSGVTGALPPHRQWRSGE